MFVVSRNEFSCNCDETLKALKLFFGQFDFVSQPVVFVDYYSKSNISFVVNCNGVPGSDEEIFQTHEIISPDWPQTR